MPNDVLYVVPQTWRIFDGTNIPEILEAVRVNWPAATVSASANYPGASATFSITTDIPDNGGYVAPFVVGDAWGSWQGGRIGFTELNDPRQFLNLSQYIRDQVTVILAEYGIPPTD